MNKSYFTDTKNRDCLYDLITSWKGTRFRHGAMVKGRAVDCALYVASLLRELGVFTSIVHERVLQTWCLHTKREVMLDGYRAQFQKRMSHRLIAVEIGLDEETQFGDILFFATTKMGVSNHCAIMLDSPNMACALEHRGTCIVILSDVWRNRLQHKYRIMHYG